jgi:hypothetical protein
MSVPGGGRVEPHYGDVMMTAPWGDYTGHGLRPVRSTDGASARASADPPRTDIYLSARQSCSSFVIGLRPIVRGAELGHRGAYPEDEPVRCPRTRSRRPLRIGRAGTSDHPRRRTPAQLRIRSREHGRLDDLDRLLAEQSAGVCSTAKPAPALLLGRGCRSYE